ncbi:hypothetical protein BDA99DRAFT_1136 [Phascolomyces articulosus]|uniref:Uncharacterized protein n=1 Tax=Phascolomyces articulosus TaxID=60185 RepID=A0AAD5KC47_9FUNG|nr:hypothetical protein BDA99DRAFT_1136 [Phascolomyces articulosus]
MVTIVREASAHMQHTMTTTMTIFYLTFKFLFLYAILMYAGETETMKTKVYSKREREICIKKRNKNLKHGLFFRFPSFFLFLNTLQYTNRHKHTLHFFFNYSTYD